jgi:APA family basic amino acid/polyamine antiporter
MRKKLGSDDLPWRGPLSFRTARYDVPLFAILGVIGTGSSFFVLVVLNRQVAVVGIAWLAFGMLLYAVYRRSQQLPLTVTVVAPPTVFGPAVEVEYRSILLPLSVHRVSDEMTVTALRLAAESGTRLVALYPIEVPLDLPLSAPLADKVAVAEHELREAAALGRQYGVSVVTRIVRTRDAGEAIVEEARRRGSEIIVMGVPVRRRAGERMFGRVTDYVLRNADCRVMVGAAPLGVT